MTDTDNARPDDDIDTELGERYYRNDKGLEARLTGDIVEVIRQFIEKRLFLRRDRSQQRLPDGVRRDFCPRQQCK